MSIVHPMIDGSRFGLLIGNKLDRSEFTEEDKIVIQMFLQLLDNAYQSYKSRQKEKQLNFSLNHRLLQLNTLIDTGIEISKLQNRNTLLEMALERAVALTNASKGIIKILRGEKVLGIIKLPNNIDAEEFDKSSNSIETTVEYRGLKYEVKLVDKESRQGYIKFDDTDEILLHAFARQVHAAVENEQLHKEALENENIKKELSVASSIQKKIIPEKLPEIEGYKLAGINIPSKEVGGDYYDCYQLNDGRFALIMADVAGKGVPASLLVSTLNASLKAYLDMNLPLSELAIKINKIIYNASPPDKFITFFIAILDPESGELDIVNAGHNPSLILRKDGSMQKIDAGGVAFGMFDMGLPFTGEKLRLENGERILLFTDGIPEAMDRDEEEYSDEKLEEFFVSNVPEDSESFISSLISDVKKFTQDTPQSDDITALYLIRN
jgi:sigma-B regulation protein RsbU (phosphoserine phosphatase)